MNAKKVKAYATKDQNRSKISCQKYAKRPTAKHTKALASALSTSERGTK